MSVQIKNRERVVQHGEVFTNEREVNAMLDLVKDQCERLEATFLEPACGDGNFLIEILRRKLQLLKKYKRQPDSYNKNLIIAVSSLYGVELLEDNAQECRERLYQEIVKHYPKSLQPLPEYSELMLSVRFILEKNIICGNALNYTKADGTPIIFYEWIFISDTQVKIRCFDFEVVAKRQYTMIGQLFSLPQHNQEFPPIHYLKLYTYAEQ